MKFIYQRFTNFTLLAVVLAMAFSVSAQRPYRVADTQVQAVITRIETRTDMFRQQVDRWANRNNQQNREQISSFVTEFENATDSLSRNFTSRNSTSADVQELLSRATIIDQFVRNNRMNNAAQSQWDLIRSDLNILAGYYRVSWNWNSVPSMPTNSNSRVYSGTDTQVQALFSRIETRTDTFKQQVERFDNRRDTQLSGQFANYVSEFENATNNLTSNFNSRRSTSADVQEVLSRAAVIDQFMRTNRVNNAAQNQWNILRGDLDTLAGYYRVSWNWNNVPTYPGNTGNNYPGDTRLPQRGFDNRLTGTYRLNTAQSDNVSAVINRAAPSLGNNVNQNDRMRRQLERRLMSPDMLVIEKRGQEIMMASSMSEQVTFNADGVSRSETNANGRMVQTRVTATNNDLTIDYEGDRMNDFYVSFMPLSNGQLRVTRRVNLENRNETVTVNSVYDKIDQIARWNNINTQTYPNDTNSNNVPNNGNYNNDFIVPNNTRLVAVLDTPLSTRKFSDGDRFTMTVTTPGQYQGAIIEGRVNGTRSGVVSGRANLTLDFDTIRLRNGSTYRFAGIVDQVREPNGDVVSVNNEGTIRDSNQTTKTVTRAGIGAALGAIIGAIAGGGQGAAIGAGIGAGAGAGSVILQGRDNLELSTGTEFSLTATGFNR